jgi:hypothetical protein
MDQGFRQTPNPTVYEAMNMGSPASTMGYESISSSDLDSVTMIATPPATNDTETVPQVGARASAWRVAHTLKNHDDVKLESPTAPALTFWYAIYLTL